MGPTSAISLMVGVTVAQMAGGDPARHAAIATLIISETIPVGFKAGAALTAAGVRRRRLGGVRLRRQARRPARRAAGARRARHRQPVGRVRRRVSGRGRPAAVGGQRHGGARSPLSLVVASAILALCLLFLSGMVRSLPRTVLAAIVLVAVKGLVDLRELARIRRASRLEFRVAMVAFAGVLLLGILKGVLIAAVASRAARKNPAICLDTGRRRLILASTSTSRVHVDHWTTARPADACALE